MAENLVIFNNDRKKLTDTQGQTLGIIEAQYLSGSV